MFSADQLIFQKHKLITKPCWYEFESVVFIKERLSYLPSLSTALEHREWVR